MAYECLMLLEKRKDILKKWQGKCRYILADEYQDIAPIQEKILSLLALPDNNLFLVGDDDQAIYGFRGAGTEIMLSFPQKYTGTKQIFWRKIIGADQELSGRQRKSSVKTKSALRKNRFLTGNALGRKK